MASKIQIGFITYWLETCLTCKTPFCMDDATHTAMLNASDKMNFHCPYGHTQYYTRGKSDLQKKEEELEKMRQDRNRLSQLVAMKDDEITLRDRQLSASRGQVTKVKNRIAAGVCPCCNRTFDNLARHMKTKHADYRKEKVA